VLLLDSGILPHQRSGGFGHGKKFSGWGADYNKPDGTLMARPHLPLPTEKSLLQLQAINQYMILDSHNQKITGDRRAQRKRIISDRRESRRGP
jgi:hypothetical protein